MKTEEEVKQQLEDIYNHRLNLRIERKTKRICRNCKHGISKEFDLGDFGIVSKWQCKDDKKCNQACGFECLFNAEQIQKEMIKDISDPAICGAKEPKIAVLLWFLHNTNNKIESNIDKQSKRSLLERLKGIFK